MTRRLTEESAVWTHGEMTNANTDGASNKARVSIATDEELKTATDERKKGRKR